VEQAARVRQALSLDRLSHMVEEAAEQLITHTMAVRVAQAVAAMAAGMKLPPPREPRIQAVAAVAVIGTPGRLQVVLVSS